MRPRRLCATSPSVHEFTAITPFPNVVIEVEAFEQAWEDHAGNHQPDCSTHRARFPVVVTNREEARRVSLRFDVTINSPDGNGVLVRSLPTEQRNELPLVVDPQDSKRIEFSVFLNEYVTERLREGKVIEGLMRYDINGDLFRLNVFDLLSRKGIEMRLPDFYPVEHPPAGPE